MINHTLYVISAVSPGSMWYGTHVPAEEVIYLYEIIHYIYQWKFNVQEFAHLHIRNNKQHYYRLEKLVFSLYALFPSSQPYLRCPQGGGDLPHHPMHMPAASGYPPHPSTLHPSRCKPQQPVASGYPPPPSDPQASQYFPQQRSSC